MDKQLSLSENKTLVPEGNGDEDAGESRDSRQVLCEEDYVAGLDAIIKRDFFPALPALTRLSGQLHAEDRAARGDTLGAQEEVDAACLRAAEEEAAARAAPRMSLDAFLARYNSEDNASFEQLHRREARHRQRAAAWLRVPEAQNARLLEAAQRTAATGAPGASLLTWPYHAKNTMFYQPDGVEAAEVSAVQGRAVCHSATRFEEKEEAGDGGGTGKKRARDAVLREYEFVRSDGSTPGATPVMTWGVVGSSPVPLAEGNRAAQRFVIPAAPKREALAHKLSDDIEAKKKRRRLFSTPAPVTSACCTPAGQSAFGVGSTPLPMLSPAGQQLLALRMKANQGVKNKGV